MATDDAKELTFPEAEVIAAIKDFWAAETRKGKSAAPTPDKPGSIMDPIVEIDSHGVVRCFTAVEEKTGIHIPETEAKDTGYDDLDDMIANLVPLAKKCFEKQKSKVVKQKPADADSDA